MLKIYGDELSTLSTSTSTVALVAVGLPDGAPVAGFLITYLNVVVVGISLTKYDPLNLSASVPVTPEIRTGVQRDRLASHCSYLCCCCEYVGINKVSKNSCNINRALQY